MGSSTRIFGEPLSMKKEFHESGTTKKFTLKTDVSRLAESTITYPQGTKSETIDFANSIEATLLAKAGDTEGFIQRVFALEQIDMVGVLSADATPETQAGWFYDVNYVAVYFAALGAVALIVIDVTRTGAEDQKFILNHNNKPFITALLGAAKQAGGISFAEKVAKVFAVKMLDAFHGLEA